MEMQNPDILKLKWKHISWNIMKYALILMTYAGSLT